VAMADCIFHSGHIGHCVMSLSMKLLPILLLAFVLSLGVGCASESAQESTTIPTPTPSVQAIEMLQHSREIGLLPEVYNRIDAMTDCRELQEAFDTSMTLAVLREPPDPLWKISSDYAQYTRNRMSEIGCP
jgi:hypothetical protein